MVNAMMSITCCITGAYRFVENTHATVNEVWYDACSSYYQTITKRNEKLKRQLDLSIETENTADAIWL